MNINKKLISLVQAIYNTPQFRTTIDGKYSTWNIQETGIRQGCSLSPYSFLIVMTAMFHDIHLNDKLKTEKHRMIGAVRDEVLFADDTICMSEHHKAIERLLHEIERESLKYGMKLNKTKCELLICGKKTNNNIS